MNSLLIKNVHIVLPGRILAGEALIENGIIAAVRTDGGSYSPENIFDGKGLFLAPGFIDIHTHGRLGVNVMDGTDALEKIAGDLPKHGVTGFLAGVSTKPWRQTLASVREIASYCAAAKTAKGNSRLSRCLGIYSETTFFSLEKRGAHNQEWLLPPSFENINALLEAGDCGGNHIRIAALSPELPGAMEAARLLRRQGITAAAAHSNAAHKEAFEGICAGISLATHTFNGMRAFHHQEPGITGTVLDDDRVSCELIADGIHLSPVVLSLVYKLKGPGRTVLVSDSVELNGLPDGNYTAGEKNYTLKEGAVRLPDGRLAGSCLDLDRAVYNMVTLAGVPLPHAVAMASLVPARILGLETKKGSIEAGKDADLILFDEYINIKAVFLEGIHFC